MNNVNYSSASCLRQIYISYWIIFFLIVKHWKLFSSCKSGDSRLTFWDKNGLQTENPFVSDIYWKVSKIVLFFIALKIILWLKYFIENHSLFFTNKMLIEWCLNIIHTLIAHKWVDLIEHSQFLYLSLSSFISKTTVMVSEPILITKAYWFW